jgi:hypothetical protein
MVFTAPEKFQFVEWFIEEGKSCVGFVRRVRGRNAQIPPERTLKDWLGSLRATGSAQSRQGKNKTR